MGPSDSLCAEESGLPYLPRIVPRILKGAVTSVQTVALCVGQSQVSSSSSE